MPSNVIDKIDYDPQRLILKIKIQTGMVYEYLNVPQKTYDDMKKAFSKGIYFNKKIKGNFEFKKVEDEN